MTKQNLFTEMIKDLDHFDQRVLFVLDELKGKQGSLNIVTSWFELFGMLRMEYSRDNVDKLDETLDRLIQAPFYLQGPSGFAIATRAVEDWNQVDETERLIISLGKLFTL
ncbi:MAG: hypothetical protein AMJ70_08930 [Dehalococcoidia bacterium SG8_51_3]|nr:MAG: hypothetical protein AMJ70_08930 [Dehalococcoidia bacterium SG8_51_3]